MMAAPQVDINYLAVLVATISNMVVGGLWYSPMLFANKWMKLIGKGEKDMEAMKQDAPKAYVLMFIFALLLNYVLAHVVGYANATNWLAGAETGFWVWLGFVVPVTISDVIFEKRSWELFWIKNGYQLVTLLLAGAILGMWM